MYNCWHHERKRKARLGKTHQEYLKMAMAQNKRYPELKSVNSNNERFTKECPENSSCTDGVSSDEGIATGKDLYSCGGKQNKLHSNDFSDGRKWSSVVCEKRLPRCVSLTELMIRTSRVIRTLAQERHRRGAFRRKRGPGSVVTSNIRLGRVVDSQQDLVPVVNPLDPDYECIFVAEVSQHIVVYLRLNPVHTTKFHISSASDAFSHQHTS